MSVGEYVPAPAISVCPFCHFPVQEGDVHGKQEPHADGVTIRCQLRQVHVAYPRTSRVITGISE